MTIARNTSCRRRVRPRGIGGFPTRAILLAVAALGASSDPASAQVIQLPTVGTFSYFGSVAVPDRGSAYLGGGASRYSYGQPRARVLSSGARTGSAVIDAQIIDLDAMDRHILDRAQGSLDRAANKPMAMNSVAPVAGIYAQPAGDEAKPPYDVRGMRLGRSSGDYLRILSHPDPVHPARSVIAPPEPEQ